MLVKISNYLKIITLLSLFSTIAFCTGHIVIGPGRSFLLTLYAGALYVMFAFLSMMAVYAAGLFIKNIVGFVKNHFFH